MKQYTLDEIHIGMEVNPKQLSEIYDKLIILDKQYMGAPTGIIRYIGDGPNAESQAVMDRCTVISAIFNDSSELDEDIEFIG